VYGGKGSGTFGVFDTDMQHHQQQQFDMQYPPHFEGHPPPGRGFAEGVRGPQQQQVRTCTILYVMLVYANTYSYDVIRMHGYRHW
jgi:hypothetical protein